MNDALMVGFIDCGANLFENIHDPVQRQPSFLSQHVAQGASIQILHHQVCDSLVAAA